MGMSKQVTFTLACAVALSAVIPGVAGYLSARIDSLNAAERRLHAQEVRLNARIARENHDVTRLVSYPAPCDGTRKGPVREQPRVAEDERVDGGTMAEGRQAAFAPVEGYAPRRRSATPPVVPQPSWLPK
ncbi:hypothetical protein OIE66_38515 [Nonomuraea sp. NBC_01738]|uniref:hypothetical protein n=1 Tax=Nonomuraea sp. NBC_01738 TaxID=2976003 RepID=UPI002E0F7E66|nr:hypothetical protein OIE66_38515 [Nonomuraea sp. NBC_01738]